jgi:hypothetical protein
MSMTAFAPGAGTNFMGGSVGIAASDLALKLRHLLFDEAMPELRRADTWNRLGRITEALREFSRECGEDNWDGYGAKAVTAGAYEEAIALLNELPRELPVPQVVPEPDGSIGLEWDNGPNRIFSVGVSGKGVIVYAGMFGKGRKSHGTEVFNDSLPENLVEQIKRIFG